MTPRRCGEPPLNKWSVKPSTNGEKSFKLLNTYLLRCFIILGVKVTPCWGGENWKYFYAIEKLLDIIKNREFFLIHTPSKRWLSPSRNLRYFTLKYFSLFVAGIVNSFIERWVHHICWDPLSGHNRSKFM